ncbi:M56 family metallopeptidase [Lewinella sp. 4G2]|uniref:M56 family metallopeptidase n=1 Tax=Lewinella sp. 4G2 TaxID=1803372 RepID=UPI0007B4C2AB|nr:M56 family metallopeptidase [Lewinella sp. 4G2]OAV43428.1 hypothetical protein A3850_002470 [Lewinella sp. 4G2]
MNYLLTASLLLLVIWPAYALLLRFSSRYATNRSLLVLGMLAVTILPFAKLPSPAPVVSERVQHSIEYVASTVSNEAELALPRVPSNGEETGPALSQGPTSTIEVQRATSVPTDYWSYGYLSGLLLLGSILCGRLLSVLTLHLRSRPKNGYRELAENATAGQAFTFGRTIYVSQDLPANADFHHILDHERVHANQLHSLDILLSEIFLCLFWFHPAAWWLRAQLRANLEYLVDQQVIRNGADKRGYQLALVRQSQTAGQLALALPFSEPTLRGRISRLTGLPEYRVVAIGAALAFLGWFGVAALVINGTQDDPSTDNLYLAASATDDDAWVAYYDRTLPAELTSFELYTDRMLTGEEYLRVRAMLAKAPGVKLYVFKNQYDPGPSLEIQYHQQEPGRMQLRPTPRNGNIYMIGLETRGSALVAQDHFAPVSMEFWARHETPGGGNGMIVYNTSTQPNSAIDFTSLTEADFTDGPIVYFNRQRVDLNEGTFSAADKTSSDYRINGVAVAELGRDEWTKVRVEGRPLESPKTRLARLAGLLDGNISRSHPALGKFVKHGFTYQSYWTDPGTFRAWYEKIDVSDDRPCKCRYNDNSVTKDFLLDTEFGPNAMMQIAYDDGTTDAISLMVLDDYPEGSSFLNRDHVEIGTPANGEDVSGPAQKINIYLKRLPSPNEVDWISHYLADFPGYQLRLYQNCTDAAGSLTLNLGDARGKTWGFDNWPIDQSSDRVRQINLTRYPGAGVRASTNANALWPPEAGDYAFAIEVDGRMTVFEGYTNPSYDPVGLDRPFAMDRFRCLMYGDDIPQTTEAQWISTYHDGSLNKMDYVLQTLEEHDYQDRPVTFYLNDKPISFEAFVETDGGSNSTVYIGGLPNRPGSPIYVQLDDVSVVR